ADVALDRPSVVPEEQRGPVYVIHNRILEVVAILPVEALVDGLLDLRLWTERDEENPQSTGAAFDAALDEVALGVHVVQVAILRGEHGEVAHPVRAARKHGDSHHRENHFHPTSLSENGFLFLLCLSALWRRDNHAAVLIYEERAALRALRTEHVRKSRRSFDHHLSTRIWIA